MIRWLALPFFAATAILMTVESFRSRGRSDGLALFSASAEVGGAVFTSHGLALVTSDIRLGPEYQWSARFFLLDESASTELDQALFGSPAVARQLFGFRFVSAQLSPFSTSAPSTVSTIVVPYWAFLIVTWVPTLSGTTKLWKDRLRSRSGHCVKCGYDLRSGHARCPECGVIAPPPSKQSDSARS